MPKRSVRRTAYWLDHGPLWLLLGFTAVAVLGYFFFALRPQNLAQFPQFASFYAISFRFFAQVHVLLTVGILFFYLFRKAGSAWLGLFGTVYGLSLASELIGTTFGLPFGPYQYTDLLGVAWFDRVPLLIPLSWFGMAVPSYVLARVAFPDHPWGRILLGGALLTAWDLSLDPAMSFLTSYWVWGEAGSFYGMPLINLFGWLVTSIALMGLFELLKAPRWTDALSVRWITFYYGLTVLMPLGMVLAAGLWGSVAATLLVIGGLGWLVYHRGFSAGNGIPQPAPVSSDDIQLPEGVPANAWNYFSQHSRSFSFAARGFRGKTRREVSLVYAFCRLTDDLVDEADQTAPEAIEQRLDAWMALSKAAYDGQASGLPWLDEVMQLTRERGAPFRLIEALGEGVRMDLGTVALQTTDELDLYAYRVASVVGVWMCYLFGVTDPAMHERAAALGRAMQITNILRDVGEDLGNNRVYLPANLLHAHGISQADLEIMQHTGTLSPAYRRVIDTLMARAEAYYEEAWKAIPHLPPAFGNVVAVAAEVYRGIHPQIVRHGYNNLTRRAYTSAWQKAVLCVRARWNVLHLRCEARKAARIQPAPEAVRRTTAKPQVGVLARFSTLMHLFWSSLLFVPMTMAQPALAPTDPSAVVQVRQYYLESAYDEALIDEAEAFIDARPAAQGDPLIQGYEAALTIMRAKHAFWPMRKMAHLKRGLPVLDELVEAHPNHAELRYLRLISCYYLPGFLGRGWSVQEDAHALVTLLPPVRQQYPPDLYQLMVELVLETDDLSQDQRMALEQALAPAPASAKSLGR